MSGASFRVVKSFDLPRPGGETPYVTKLASPADMSSIAAATSAKSIVLFDPQTLQPLRELCGHQSTIYDLEYFRGTHTSLVSCAGDGTAKIWDVRAADPMVRSLNCAPMGCNAAGEVFSCSTNDSLCAVSVSEKIHLFDVGSGKRQYIYQDVHTDVVNFLRFHPVDTDCLVSGSDDNLICVVDSKCFDEEECLRSVLSNEDNVRFFSFVGPDRTILCTSSTTETLRIWNVHPKEHEYNGTKLAEITGVRDHPQLTHEGSWGYAIDVFFDTKQQRMFCLGGSSGGDLRLLHTNLEGVSDPTPFLAEAGQGHSAVVRSAVCLRDNVIVTGGEDGRIIAWRGDDATAAVALETNSYSNTRRNRSKTRATPY